jgi:hypothetical protein
LCGRGASINSHLGNENFRLLVEKRKRVYLTTHFKLEKRLIASSICTQIRQMDPPGRFLAKEGGKNGHWYDIGEEKARDKTSQALRENAPTIRAEIETEIYHQRKEMKRKEEEEDEGAYPPSHPPPHAYYQQYWDYYYSYYNGYPPHPPPPPHGAPPPHPLTAMHLPTRSINGPQKTVQHEKLALTGDGDGIETLRGSQLEGLPTSFEGEGHVVKIGR